MRIERKLFFTLILFLIIFSISFVSASENLTCDSNTGELTTLSVCDDTSIEYDLTKIKSDSIESNSNDGIMNSVDENLNESKLNSIEGSSNPQLDQGNDEQDIDEIESNDCLTLNDKAQLLRASSDEEILGEGPYTKNGNVITFYDDGTVSNIIDAINELNDLIDFGSLENEVACFDGHTFTGSGNLNDKILKNIWVLGGPSPFNYSKYARFTYPGIAMWFSGNTMTNCRFSNIIS